MKKKFWIHLIICFCLLTGGLVLTGCGQTQEEAPIVNPVNITIAIDYPKKSGIDDVEESSFTVEEGSTVLDAIQLYCNVNDQPITVETTDGSVHGINGVDNGDYNAEKTWQYKINGELMDTPESQQVLEEGDRLEWVYRK